MQDMKKKHKELEEQFETIKTEIIETTNKKSDSSVLFIYKQNK